ncbi:DUF6635 family protein [Leucothrix arctica]|uniref:Uncharacterized protein n=1 Tax=Leucothrix arctica TaxID=1481894 RepID=A0A317CKE4_9GAMM|nr:DUF6635 family protein [Leucothrix arctica]PWQ96790.1 hypothetical protein DKT75_08460 [Leucothrix arctica]
MGGLHRKLGEGEVLALIGKAITVGSGSYIGEREKRIGDFVRRHYSFRGALKIHRHAFGWDLIRVPVNILLSVVRTLLALFGFLAGLVGLKKPKDWIKKIPLGLQTNMDRQISWLIVTELLELPYQQGQKISDNDALMTEVLKDPHLRSLLNEKLDTLSEPAKSPEFRAKLDAKLAEYGATRTASSELATSTTLLVTSKIALGQASFGALSAGAAVSAAVANSAAASSFWLGSMPGLYYYAVFPVAASVSQLMAVTVVICIVLALISTFIGILTDPLQAKLGIHQKRLKKLVSAVGSDLSGKKGSDFHLREKYAGRLFDIIDVLSTVGRSL